MNKSKSPVYSMTGYASGADAAYGLNLEIKSVNSRFLDLTFKVPDHLRPLESAFREEITRYVRRGKLELKLAHNQVAKTQDAQARWGAQSEAQIRQLLARQAQIQAIYPSAQSLSVAEILSLTRTAEDEETAEVSPQAKILLTAVLAEFLAARALEGGKLVDTMRLHVKALTQLRQAMLPLMPDIIETQRQKFLQRFAQAVSDAQAKLSSAMVEERALTEATAFALRIDVGEELTRLDSHLTEIDQLLGNGGEVGKRSEFLIQELQREANTLGAKSAATQTSKIALEMKVLIEQLREQVQNLE